ncbi:uncharacterized protein LOC141666028 [Apium graveolens]|uniref:uncharacterized protein LOC141666028 n=1 Tax=Apium graveolens TaxID=4045 RepID=UPI003D7B8D71
MAEFGLVGILECGQSSCTLAMLRVPFCNYISNFNHTSTPWCLMGDFDCVISLNEISGGREHWTPDMQSFKDCVVNSGLGIVKTIGDRFTWTNKCPQNPVFRRLDRMLKNALWFQIFTEGCTQIKTRGLMDHNPILYEELIQINRVGKPFQFFNFMLEIPEFTSVATSSWSRNCVGNHLVQFNFKLKNVKTALRDINKRHRDLHVVVHSLRDDLKETQIAIVSDNSESLAIHEQLLIDKLNLALLQEENLLLQKSRVKWLKEGDGNNSFFHQQCKANWNHNKVLSIQNEEGVLVHGQQQCAEVAVSYFQKLMENAVSQRDDHTPDLSNVCCASLNDA